MSDPIVIKQPKEWLVKVIWVFILCSIPLTIYLKDISIANRISIYVLSALLFIVYISTKNQSINLTVYLLAISFLLVFSLLNQQAGDYGYLFILSLPPLINAKRFEAEALMQNEVRLLNDVVEAIHPLFTKADQSAAIEESLAKLAHAINVDCIYAFENTFPENRKEYLLTKRYQWVKEVYDADSYNEEIHYIKYINKGEPHWIEILSSGLTIQGPASAFPKNEQSLMESKGIESILVVPIMIEDQFWGFMRFDDCENERYWTIDEENILLTVASAIGRAIKELERVKQEEELKQRCAKLEALISHMDYGVVAEDKDNGLILINEQFYNMFGVPPLSEEELGITHDEYFNRGKSSYVEGEVIQVRNKEIFASRQKIIGEEWELKDGRIIKRDAIPIFTNGVFDGYLWQFKETTEQKRHEQKLKEASIIDGLTKIYNRRYFDEMLEKEWGRSIRNVEPLTLIMLDIDGFKAFNDSYGHQKGDACLIQVAQTIKEILRRPSDVVCRYGGEEFVIILPETHQRGGIKIAEKIRKAILALKIAHRASDVNDYVTCSLGVASVTPTKYMPPEEIIRMADQALYTSKTLGRNCVNFYRLQKHVNSNIN